MKSEKEQPIRWKNSKNILGTEHERRKCIKKNSMTTEIGHIQ